VARLTLNRPKALNALDETMAREFAEAIADFDADAGVRVVVVTGAGRAFFAGGDVAAFKDNLDSAAPFLKKLTATYHSALARMTRMKKPVLAAINGVTAGAGIGLALAADLAVAARSAVFNVAYTAIAASPDGSTSFFLPRLIGLRRAMELTLLNRALTADEAVEWGLINRAVDDDKLPAEIDALAAKLAAGPTAAYGACKRLLYASFANSLETQMENEAQSIAALAAETRDFREGIAAFVEKRKPAFKGD
jgi:2-(1,2-epoxy-1,2-dihydrophenyl)acetyl-CoA isomerase